MSAFLGDSVMISNHFVRGPESWCSYDYHASMVAGKHNVFTGAVGFTIMWTLLWWGGIFS